MHVCKVRWKIEEFHKEIKQLTGIYSVQCRKARIGEKSYCLCYVGLVKIETFSLSNWSNYLSNQTQLTL